jgi:hypothetical protein
MLICDIYIYIIYIRYISPLKGETEVCVVPVPVFVHQTVLFLFLLVCL